MTTNGGTWVCDPFDPSVSLALAEMVIDDVVRSVDPEDVISAVGALTTTGEAVTLAAEGSLELDCTAEAGSDGNVEVAVNGALTTVGVLVTAESDTAAEDAITDSIDEGEKSMDEGEAISLLDVELAESFSTH